MHRLSHKFISSHFSHINTIHIQQSQPKFVRFFSSHTMNRGGGRGGGRGRNGGNYQSGRGSPNSAGRYSYRPVGSHGSVKNASYQTKDEAPRIWKQVSEKSSVGVEENQFSGRSPSQHDSTSPSVGSSSTPASYKSVQNPPSENTPQQSEKFPATGSRTQTDVPALSSQSGLNQRRSPETQSQEECRISSDFNCISLSDTKRGSQKVGSGLRAGYSREGRGGRSGSLNAGIGMRADNLDGPSNEFSFDICIETTGNVVKLKSPLHVKNREKRNEVRRHVEGDNIKMLRPGMIILKGYLSLEDQVKLIKKCRDLGRGTGGFYQPGYRDGAKLHLKMMCLGKNWDPQTCLYTEERPADGARAPTIPPDFTELVHRAVLDSQSYLKSVAEVRNVEDVLPSMSPNICIINFYSKTSRLGLHQDKDESQESIQRGLPVVSFSVGDSAEFLYGDQRDVDKAEKIVLESGDVLIFGGKSRNIFHGVTSIIPDTAPKSLLEEANLRPGRLNLTFREY